jgi:hypothetical protein
MQSLFIEYIYLVLIIPALVMLANKLRLAVAKKTIAKLESIKAD